MSSKPSTSRRSIFNVIPHLILTILFALSFIAIGCGGKFSEGLRVMTGQGGTKELNKNRHYYNATVKTADILNRYQPKPEWQTVFRADEADILRFISSKRVLVGEVIMSSAISMPSYGSLALHDADTGTRLWEHKRRDINGSYSLVMTEPLILLRGDAAGKSYYTAIAPETGMTIYDFEVSQPHRIGFDLIRGNLLLASYIESKVILKAVNLTDGTPVWEKNLGKVPLKAKNLLLISYDDFAFIAADEIIKVSKESGETLWSVPRNSKGGLNAFVTSAGLILSDRKSIRVLDIESGEEVWEFITTAGGISLVSTAVVDDGMILFAAYPYSVNSLDVKTGKLTWEYPLPESVNLIPKKLQSPLLTHSGKVYFVAGAYLISLDGETGKADFTTKIDDRFLWFGKELPMVLKARGDNIIVAMEHSGVMAFSAATGKEIYSQHLGQKDAQTGLKVEKPYYYYMIDSRILMIKSILGDFDYNKDAYIQTAQRISDSSLMLARIDAGDVSASLAMGEKLIKEAASKVATESAMPVTDYAKTAAEQTKYKQRRGSSGTGLRYRNLDPGLAATASRVDAAGESLSATMDFANAMYNLSISLEIEIRASALMGLLRRKHMEFANSYNMHLNSLQGDYYIRPYADKGDGLKYAMNKEEKRIRAALGYAEEHAYGKGVTLIDLDSGSRADFKYAAFNDPMNLYGVNMANISIDPEGKRLIITGIGIDPARFEKYVKFKVGMPYPSLISYDLSKIPFTREKSYDDAKVIEVADSLEYEKLVKLKESGSDISRKNRYGESPLIEAILSGYAKTVKLLIESGADVNVKDEKGQTVLMKAAKKGRTEAANVLIEKGAKIGAKDNDGYTALLHAAYFGHADTIKLLVEKGADMDDSDQLGRSAFVLSVKNSHLEAAKLLNDMGAKVTGIDYKGFMGDTAFTYNAKKGNIELVKLLVKKDADINMQNDNGHTALMLAAKEGAKEVVRFLIDAGADVNLKDKDGKTALRLIKYRERDEIKEMLRKAGAK